MLRRTLLERLPAIGILPVLGLPLPAPAGLPSRAPMRRVRPSDPAWPDVASWYGLNQVVGGRLIRVASPLAACREAPSSAACNSVFRELKNPYYVGDTAGLTQTTGWLDAWTSRPSVWAVAAETAQHVAATVDFARKRNLRLVVKGGGHSYLGTSNAPDSLLVWTRHMNRIVLHDDFVAAGCAGREPPQPAVTVGAGAVWGHVYERVTTRGGRYVQGGGCLTVGVAGLVQAGGFGSFSKNFGIAAAGLIEAEIVTADGRIRTANACTNADLFWALKGGGGGSLGVVTRLTLKTHPLPACFGAVLATIEASSGDAFGRLIAAFVDFYADRLANRHWGEIVTLRPDNRLDLRMIVQGLDRRQAEAVWRPFFGRVGASPQDYRYRLEPKIIVGPARDFWDADFLERHVPGVVLRDDRPGAPPDNFFWAANRSEAGHFLYGFRSLWLPQGLLRPDRRAQLAAALTAAARRWSVELHFQKGLAGAPAAALSATRDTAMNPAVLDSFGLAIIAGEGPPALPGLPGHEPDFAAARRAARSIVAAMSELEKMVPERGSYCAESDFFEPRWQSSYWGRHYPRLLSVKKKYDPDGLFFVHHGVGSEEWSADGFTRLS